MSKISQNPRPIVRPAAGFHPDDTGLQFCKELRDGIAPESFSKHNPITIIDGVNFKNVFGQVKADPFDLHDMILHLSL